MQLVASIVSHNQAGLLAELLNDLDALTFEKPILFIVTENSANPQSLVIAKSSKLYKNGLLQCVRNPRPLGFGANHNQAFGLVYGQGNRQADNDGNNQVNNHAENQADVFFVLNPDLRIDKDIFSGLSDSLNRDPSIGIIAPEVLNPNGIKEDSARYFPSIARILRKVFFKDLGLFQNDPSDPNDRSNMYFPDWIAGMCLGFTKQAYTDLKGFDERYFMYYEDADICRRAHTLGFRPAVNPAYRVVHAAQRTSHKRIGLLFHHLASMLRFLSNKS